MISFRALFSRIYLKCVELDWSVLVFVALAHYSLSYIGFSLAGEAALLTDNAFPYYYFTTVSTVGYGDLSPTTPWGRVFFVAFVLPGGLTVFTIALGKAIGSFSDYFRKKANGMGDYSKIEGATVIIGYQPQHTFKMIDEILAGELEDQSALILISRKDVPTRSMVRYVRADSLSSLSDLRRGAVEHASKIVVCADNDDLTLTAVLAARSLNKAAHLVCYFNDGDKASLLGEHCEAEIIVSPRVELMARELTDPGSSNLMADLVSAQSGVATFSLEVPAGGTGMNRREVTELLAQKFGATLISVRQRSSGDHQYDPRSAAPLAPGDTLFYIGENRVDGNAIIWQE